MGGGGAQVDGGARGNRRRTLLTQLTLVRPIEPTRWRRFCLAKLLAPPNRRRPLAGWFAVSIARPALPGLGYTLLPGGTGFLDMFT